LSEDLTKPFVYAEGTVRTNCDCTSCGKIFIAKINHDLDGNHVLRCPFCGHQHFRTIRKGIVTGDRWSSQSGPNIDVPTERMWSDQTLDIKTTSAANHIRDTWLKGTDKPDDP
jgi:DNA-directed RNA polymerase subunit RPC12/RpoP